MSVGGGCFSGVGGGGWGVVGWLGGEVVTRGRRHVAAGRRSNSGSMSDTSGIGGIDTAGGLDGVLSAQVGTVQSSNDSGCGGGSRMRRGRRGWYTEYVVRTKASPDFQCTAASLYQERLPANPSGPMPPRAPTVHGRSPSPLAADPAAMGIMIQVYCETCGATSRGGKTPTAHRPGDDLRQHS